MSQRNRILAMLESAGPAGVHSFELYEARMPRGAAVIHSLKAEGFRIDATHEVFRGGAKGVRYRLIGGPRPVAPVPPPAARPDGLFTTPSVGAVSPYDVAA